MQPLLLGKLRGIAIRPARGEPMLLASTAVLRPGVGIEAEKRKVSEKRQVTLLSEQQWIDVCRDMNTAPDAMPWTTRRANLLIDVAPMTELPPGALPPYKPGMRFPDKRDNSDPDMRHSLLPLIGQRLRIGEVVIEPAVETKPCSHIDALTPGLRAALLPAGRGGVCCRVHTAGEIRQGDAVMLLAADETACATD